jgi:GAF domain-containing protein
MARYDALTTANEYQDLLLESPGFTEFLLGLATISASQLGAGSITVDCTITVERDGAPATVARSSERGRLLDETQYSFDAGPCLSALRHQRAVLIHDLGHDERWGHYMEAIADVGIHSVLAFPILTDPSSRAALNCYAESPFAFDEAAVNLIEEQAASMSRILRLALRLHGPEVFPDGLRAELRSRAMVDAALALVMIQNRSGREAAMGLLQAAASSTNRKLRDVAGDILDTGGLSVHTG